MLSQLTDRFQKTPGFLIGLSLMIFVITLFTVSDNYKSPILRKASIFIAGMSIVTALRAIQIQLRRSLPTSSSNKYIEKYLETMLLKEVSVYDGELIKEAKSPNFKNYVKQEYEAQLKAVEEKYKFQDVRQEYEAQLKAVEDNYRFQDVRQHYDYELRVVKETYKSRLESKEELIEISRLHNRDLMDIIKSLSEGRIGIKNSGGNAEIRSIVAESINELPSSPDPNKPGIKELLYQLTEATITEPSLSDKDKAETLEQVKALAEAGKNSSDEAKKEAAKTDIKTLKGMVSSLPTTTKLVEACNKLLPEIAKIFGLA